MDVSEHDHYAILGLQFGDSPDAVKRAYHRFALLVHPDKIPNEHREAAEAAFKVLSNAHKVLSDESLRVLYDERYGSVQQLRHQLFNPVQNALELFHKLSQRASKKRKNNEQAGKLRDGQERADQFHQQQQHHLQVKEEEAFMWSSVEVRRRRLETFSPNATLTREQDEHRAQAVRPLIDAKIAHIREKYNKAFYTSEKYILIQKERTFWQQTCPKVGACPDRESDMNAIKIWGTTRNIWGKAYRTELHDLRKAQLTESLNVFVELDVRDYYQPYINGLRQDFQNFETENVRCRLWQEQRTAERDSVWFEKKQECSQFWDRKEAASLEFWQLDPRHPVYPGWGPMHMQTSLDQTLLRVKLVTFHCAKCKALKTELLAERSLRLCGLCRFEIRSQWESCPRVDGFIDLDGWQPDASNWYKSVWEDQDL